MKRLTMILALLLMVAMPMMAERVSPETARKVATTFLNNNGAKSAQLTDLSKAAGFVNLYIFNGEEGFVVMAADDCVQPILGYSLTGRFVAENMPTNVSGWLQGYNDEIQYAIDNQMRATSEVTRMWKELVEGNAKTAKATIVVDALIQTTWDQNPGYNDLCPYDNSAGELTVTGCVATAMAQIMRYWEYPSHGVGSHSYTPSAHPEYGTQSVNFAQQTYDWADMPLYSPNAEIAKLMYHCGVAVNMDYGIGTDGGSGAFNTAIAPALTNYFNYKSTASLKYKQSYSNTHWINLLKTELNAGRPIQYNGSGSGGGHAFVCDGYDSNNYFHFNWGWSGNCDAFYTVNNLNPGPGGTGSGDYGVYNDNQSIVIGIEPKDCTASTPTSFNVTTEDRNALLTWNAASNAVSYFIYRNGLLVANTTNTTYPDSDLAYGTYAYYVKSVDSNGAKSSPTATITISIEPTASSLTVTKNGNQAILNWTEPEWVTPQTDNEVLTYGDVTGNRIYSLGLSNLDRFYWGHRYSTSSLINKVIYKVSFYVTQAGLFSLHIYKGSSASSSNPKSQIWNQSIEVTTAGWVDIVFTNPIQIDNSKDLWVFIYNQEAMDRPAGGIEYSGDDGNYIASSPTSYVQAWSGFAFLIRTYITDGSFFYNLYDGTTTIASNISSSTYTVNNIANNTAHRYTLKTNFNGGLTEASNMAGLTIGEASLASLNLSANDQMTITEGSKLTVSGTLSDVNADNLILEDGAQLVNNSSGVQATVKKTISPYSQTPGQNDGWNLIASPITEAVEPTATNGLLTNNYDLYTFDQSKEKEWRNYEATPKPFTTIDNGIGYLYANSGKTTLTFTGTLANTATETSLVYNSDARFKGFNLIGNPYACNAYIDRSFYVLNENGDNFIEGSNPIAPCAAILVQAQNAEDNSVTFSKNASKNNPSIVATIKAMQTKGETVIDKARVSFKENDNLTKFTSSQHSAQLYIPQGNSNYAVACANGQNEMPLNFKAAQNGTYTLDFKVENMGADYLHLIDNMTGADVDLLATPNYTFEATTDDYEARFRLAFITNETDGPSTSSGAFAYINNGDIIITGVEDACNASLQVVDMMGRVVLAGEAMNRVSTNGMTAGVYVLRLINGEQVKTQKMIIE